MILPKITNKQQDILDYITQFRFINTKQLLSLLKHKDKKTINTWLKDLIEKQYIKRIYDPHTFGENTKPAIFFMGINGIRYLKTRGDMDIDSIRKLYKEKTRKQPFINRSLLIADCGIALTTNSTTETIFAFATESDYLNPDSPMNFLKTLKPHLYFSKQTGKIKKYYLLEIFDETLPAYRVRKRVRAYIDFFFSNEWEDNTKKLFPVVLFICPTKPHFIRTKRYTMKILEENQNPEDLQIRLATVDLVKQFSVIGNIWEEV